MTTKQMDVVELSEQLAVLGEAARQLLQDPNLDLHYQRQTSANYETELIQVAASAIAALTDLRLQQGCPDTHVHTEIELEIYQERLRQDRKYGAMPRRLDPLVWTAVILSELHEVSEEVWG